MEKKMEFTFGYGGVLVGVLEGTFYLTRIEPPTGKFGLVEREEMEELKDKAVYTWRVSDKQYLNDILELAQYHEPFVLELDNGVIINANKYVKESFDNLIDYIKCALGFTK